MGKLMLDCIVSPHFVLVSQWLRCEYFDAAGVGVGGGCGAGVFEGARRGGAR